MERPPASVDDTARKLRVLILEDSARDAELILRELRSFGYEPQWTRVESEEDFRAHIHPELDLVLADFTLPQFDALSALKILQEKGLTTPFVIVTGSIAEETAVSILKQGADDFLLKDRLIRLGPAVANALRQRRLRDEGKRAQQQLVEHEERYRRLITRMSALVIELDPKGTTLFVNETVAKLTGFAPDEVLGRSWFELFFAGGAGDQLKAATRILSEGQDLRHYVTQCRTKAGAPLYLEWNTANEYGTDGRLQKIIAFGMDISERRRLEQQREADAQRLAELSRRVVAVQEEERRRLAAELHDRSSPNLAAAALNLGMIADDLPPGLPDGLEARLADTRALLADTTAGIRDVCAELRPATLDYAGLPDALREYAQQFSRRTGIAVKVSAERSAERGDAESESMLFRIAQEALTNCAKHAHASAVKVELSFGNPQMVLTVSDNGAGFDPEALGQAGHRPGLGLLTMRERVEFAGGKFDLESAPGKGTRIRVEIHAGAA